VLTTVLVGIMAVGAVFAVANTMYAAVDNRRREIAMLRTLGFGRLSIVTSFVLESLMVCGAACALGLCASFFVNGVKEDYLSDATWTVLAYELKITPEIIFVAVLLSVLVGVAGAMAPAWRASRLSIVATLRNA
jgi:putative ABC transport system permease protein